MAASSITASPIIINVDTDFVILRIWERKGEHVGHASLQLADGTYISLFPVRPVLPASAFDAAAKADMVAVQSRLLNLWSSTLNGGDASDLIAPPVWQTLEQDREAEGCDEHHRFRLFTFDNSKIKAEFARLKGTVLFGVGTEARVHVCSSFVWHLLKHSDKCGLLKEVSVSSELVREFIGTKLKQLNITQQSVDGFMNGIRDNVKAHPWLSLFAAFGTVYLIANHGDDIVKAFAQTPAGQQLAKTAKQLVSMETLLSRFLDNNLRSPKLLHVVCMQIMIKERLELWADWIEGGQKRQAIPLHISAESIKMAQQFVHSFHDVLELELGLKMDKATALQEACKILEQLVAEYQQKGDVAGNSLLQ